MKRKDLALLSTKLMVGLVFVVFSVSAFAQIEVRTAEDLNNVRNNMTASYVQVADIDLDGMNWQPIGAARNEFTGTYDGRGHVIRNLRIERDGQSDSALFGGLSGTIKNLGIENASISAIGGRQVGMLVGTMLDGTIEQCYVSGDISGQTYVGGLIGYLRGREASIVNCYAVGSAIAEETAGGLIGDASLTAIIQNCYAAVYISGNPDLVGGLIGRQTAGTTVRGSFWDTEVSTANASDGGTGRTTEQMLMSRTFSREWDMREVWAIEEGESYPYLVWQREPGEHNYPPAEGNPSNLVGVSGDEVIFLTWDEPPAGEWTGYNIYRDDRRHSTVGRNITQFEDRNVVNYTQYSYYVTAIWEDESESRPSNAVIATPHLPFAGGRGTAEEPFQIANAQNLNDMRFHMDDHFVLQQDINIGVPPWNQGEGWEPIGFYVNTTNCKAFKGSLNGDGNVIRGLTIIGPTTNSVAFFGYTQGATIFDIKFENVTILGYDNVATIAVRADGATVISNCNVNGVIEGHNSIGGLVNSWGGQEIDGCYFSGEINGFGAIGGLVSKTERDCGPLKNSGSDATVVAAHQYSGGLVAQNNGVIESCHFSGSLTASGSQAGGIVGQNSGQVTKCFVDGRIRGTGSPVGGIAGENAGTSSVSFSYFSGGLEGYRTVGGIVGSNGGNSITPRPIVSILNCYSTGTIAATDEAASTNLGGITGYTYGDVINCYSTSRITGPAAQVYGLIASVRAPYTTTNSYWDTEASGVASSVGGTSRLTRQMTYPYDEATYVDWDFDEIWQDDPDGIANNGYPILFWQEIPPLLDSPVVTASVIKVDGNDYCQISWEGIEGASSYKVYAANVPNPANWGDPVDITEETEYREAVDEVGSNRFYKVVASTNPAP